MSNYIPRASWSEKDALNSGETLKKISATELGTEFDEISTMSAQKAEKEGNSAQDFNANNTAVNNLTASGDLTVTGTLNTSVDDKVVKFRGRARDVLYFSSTGTTSGNITLDYTNATDSITSWTEYDEIVMLLTNDTMTVSQTIKEDVQDILDSVGYTTTGDYRFSAHNYWTIDTLDTTNFTTVSQDCKMFKVIGVLY